MMVVTNMVMTPQTNHSKIAFFDITMWKLMICVFNSVAVKFSLSVVPWFNQIESASVRFQFISLFLIILAKGVKGRVVDEAIEVIRLKRSIQHIFEHLDLL
jgi:hypothetical protein